MPNRLRLRCRSVGKTALPAVAVLVIALSTGCTALMPKIPGTATQSRQALGGATTTTIPPVAKDRTVELLATDIRGGRHVVDCVRVLQPSQYAEGLSGGPVTHGAVFTFRPPAQQGFWMKNTATRLVIYWTAANGSVIGQADMTPETSTIYTPSAPVALAAEIPANITPIYGIDTLTLGAGCSQNG